MVVGQLFSTVSDTLSSPTMTNYVFISFDEGLGIQFASPLVSRSKGVCQHVCVFKSYIGTKSDTVYMYS